MYVRRIHYFQAWEAWEHGNLTHGNGRKREDIKGKFIQHDSEELTMLWYGFLQRTENEDVEVETGRIWAGGDGLVE